MRWLRWLLGLLSLVSIDDGCQLVDMALEYPQLILIGASCCDDLHQTLKL